MGCKNTIFLVLVATLITKEALATQHVVGGSQGWDQSTDFNSWTSGQTFKVGDQLVFKYSSLYSVVELGSESAYKTCDISNPVNTLSSGNDVVKLDKLGTRYFTCGTMSHCGQGMKVKIKIVKGNAAFSLASSSSLSSSPSSSPSPSSCSSSCCSSSSASASTTTSTSTTTITITTAPNTTTPNTTPPTSASISASTSASNPQCLASFMLIVVISVSTMLTLF